MAKIKLNKLKTDPNKAGSALDFEFHPLADYPDVTVYGKHLMPGEGSKAVTVQDDGTIELNHRGLFRSKVTSIENLTIEYKDGEVEYTTARSVTDVRGNAILNQVVIATANFILNGGKLEDDEVKN